LFGDPALQLFGRFGADLEARHTGKPSGCQLIRHHADKTARCKLGLIVVLADPLPGVILGTTGYAEKITI
jgi:hypothetical protein